MDNNSREFQAGTRDVAVSLGSAMNMVYSYMSLGLLITAVFAFMAASSESFMLSLTYSPALFYGLIIGELLLVFVLSATVRSLPSALSLFLFFVYSAVNGLTLSVIFLIYTTASIYSSFLVTCLTFGAMSLIGFFTKKNLTSVGHYLMMALIGVVIAMIVNLFVMNDMFTFLITIVCLLVFIGLTAYDTQKIKNWMQADEGTGVKKIAVWGALTLYLDFINIFLSILRLFGKRR